MPVTSNLANVANNARMVAPMDLGGSAPSIPGDFTGGITTATGDLSARIQKAVQKYGYLYGYIMRYAPRIEFAMLKKKKDKGTAEYEIGVRQTRPSSIERVLVTLPAMAICNGEHTIASPEEIQQCAVDYNRPVTDVVNLVWEKDVACAYLLALGGIIPEYKPNVVEGASEQWPAQLLESGSPDVSYVKVTARKKPNAATGITMNLKCTTRRTLLTQHNFVALRAYEHIPLKPKADAAFMYELNESAFGTWRNRRLNRESTVSMLEDAINQCPSQIARTTYTFTDKNGETVEKNDGIMSCFTLDKNAKDNALKLSGAHAEMVQAMTATSAKFVPWYTAATQKKDEKTSYESATRIVKREYRETKSGDKKLRTIPLNWRDNKNAEEFAPYVSFAANAQSAGYVTAAQLDSLATASNRGSKQKTNLLADKDIKAGFTAMLRDDTFKSRLDEARREFAVQGV